MTNAGWKNQLPIWWRTLAPVFLLAVISSPGFAGPIEDARAAFARGDARTWELYLPWAEKGLAEAQATLGFLSAAGDDTIESHKWLRMAADQGHFQVAIILGFNFAYGYNGFPINYREAVTLFRIAANKGDATAQCQLGISYGTGRGVPQDYVEAGKWLRLASEQGDASAQGVLAGMCFNGEGVPQSYAEAGQWYRKSADQGNALAQYNLATMYYNGQGVPQDFVVAHMWFNLAASILPASGEPNRDRAVQWRDAVAAEMTPAQIAEAQRLAREWKPK